MNYFDFTIIRFFNAFAQHSRSFDFIIVHLGNDALLKGGVMMALFWWAWNQDQDAYSEKREYLLFGLLSSIFALFLSRIFALTLPFRERPLRDPLLGFHLPIGMDPNLLIGWSSFPSDHAALFFCFAASLWLVSKRLGSIALFYALVVICLPRIYLGIHYPTDIIAGAVLGMAVACLSRGAWLRKSLTHTVLRWSVIKPAAFYATLFLVTYEIAELFDSARHFGLAAYKGLQGLLIALR